MSETIGSYKCLRYRIKITAQAQKKHLLRDEVNDDERETKRRQMGALEERGHQEQDLD